MKPFKIKPSMLEIAKSVYIYIYIYSLFALSLSIYIYIYDASKPTFNFLLQMPAVMLRILKMRFELNCTVTTCLRNYPSDHSYNPWAILP